MYVRLVYLLLIVLGEVDCRLIVPGLYESEYVVEGDITLGFLYDVSLASEIGSSKRCSSEFRYSLSSFVQRSELMSFCTREINGRSDLLPNITVGFVMKNTCSSDLNALARTVFMVPDHLPSCTGNLSWPERVKGSQYPVHRKVAGIIGPMSSRQSVAISSLTSVFQIPTLSTMATSDELMDKARFAYFLRMVPTDSASVQGIFDVIRSFGWTYIAVIYSDGSYGEYGFRAILRMAKRYAVCLAVSHQLLTGSTDDDFEIALGVLERNPKANVVIAFGQYSLIKGMFRYMVTNNRSLSRVWLGGDSLCGDYVIGALCFHHPFSIAPTFATYIREMVSPWTRPDNPWLKQIWSNIFTCSWQNSSNHCNSHRTLAGKVPSVTSYSGLVCDAVSVYAHALHMLISRHCNNAFSDRSLLENCVTGPRLLNAMKTVSFQGIQKYIEFGSDGELVPHYLIYFSIESKTSDPSDVDLLLVGEWKRRNDEGILLLNRSMLDWYRIDGKGQHEYPESLCSKPCGRKQYQIRLEQKCCWNCHDCQVNEILVNNRTGCEECPQYWWPEDENALECEPIQPKYLKLGDPIANGLAVLALIGLIVCVAIIIIFSVKRHTRLVKASNRELSIVMLVGAMLACLDIFSYLVKPTLVSCGFRQVGFHFVVNLLYSPLFVKTNRIYRIFSAGKKGNSRPRYVSSKWQTTLVCVTIGIQVILLLGILISGQPEVELIMPVRFEKFVEITCQENLVKFIMPLSYNVLLALTCAFLGYHSRKLPENFNESGFIFISVATTLFMWLVFLPTHFTSLYSYNQVSTLGFCILLNVYITIGCLFLPKIYALYFISEDDLTFNTFTHDTQLTSATNASQIAPVD